MTGKTKVRNGRGTGENAPAYEPTMEDLSEWINEGGCPSACIHEAWVEHDGHCPECGAGSWFLAMGLI